MNHQVSAGIDIGGTKIAIALEDPAGERVATRRLPTEVHLGPDVILDGVMAALSDMIFDAGARLGSIGVGCPGPIDIDRGLVLSPANLPDWVEYPLIEKIENRFRVPVVFDNDANAAALGEYFRGAGRGFRNVLYVTISTGIGGAIICDGAIHHGVTASAGEIGHTIVCPEGRQCLCGNRGCLETIASGTSIARRMKERLDEAGTTIDYEKNELNAEKVVEMVVNGDETALRVWDETIHYLAIGIGNAITTIAPEAVVIGGGVSSAGDVLFEPLRLALRRTVSMLPIDRIAIKPASLGAESGVCGALILARSAHRVKQEKVY